jgi:outer membrane lipoprotein-sorting protein
MLRALLCLLVVAAGSRADEPWLPRIARSLQASPGWKIELSWTVKPVAAPTQGRTTSGTLHLADSNRFRFASAGLNSLCDGNTTWQHLPATGQVLVQSVDRLDPALLPGTLLAQALRGAELSARREALAGKDAVRLELPTGKGAFARHVRASLWARPSDLRPLRLSLVDAQGNETLWELSSWTRWKPEPDAFRWTAPAGAEVVDLRD